MVNNLPTSLFRFWLIASLLLLLLQSYGGLLPHDQDVHFYVGYFATPFFLGFLMALAALLVSKYFQKRR